jgi:hypothetical protein
MKQIKMSMFHIGTLNHKNNEVCDPDPLIYHQIPTHTISLSQLPTHCQKTGKKADSAVSAA